MLSNLLSIGTGAVHRGIGFLLNDGLDADQLKSMTDPIIGLFNSIMGPAIAVVGAVGAIYCILLGVKLAKAEEPQEREKAKVALKNAIIGFLLIFILVVLLRLGVPALSDWMGRAAPAAGAAA